MGDLPLPLGLEAVIHSGKLDIVKNVPLEISIIILRMLDGETLWVAQQVSHGWSEICISDRIIKDKIRRYCNEIKLIKRRTLFSRIWGTEYEKENELYTPLLSINRQNIRNPVSNNYFGRKGRQKPINKVKQLTY